MHDLAIKTKMACLSEKHFSQKNREFLISGMPEFDSATGGLQRGAITEIFGNRSSAKTAFVLSAVAQATQRSEFAVIIDPTDSLDPSSAEKAGVDLKKLLWVRCPESLDSALKASDYLLHAGGFGIVVLDLADVRPDLISRIPQSYWYRFRLALENTRAVFVLVSPVHCAGSSCPISVECLQKNADWSASPEHPLFQGIHPCFAFRKGSGMLRAGQNPRAVRQVSVQKIKTATSVF